MMRKARLVVALFVALGVLSSAIAPAWANSAAAQPKVVMTARGGYGDDGSFIMGEWFPIYVALNNPAGGSNMRVRVEVDALGTSSTDPMGTYIREVDLPSPSRKEVTLYTFSGHFTHALDVRLVQGSREIARSSVKLSPLERTGNLIVGVISSDNSLLNILKGEKLGHMELIAQNNPYSSSSTPPTPTASIVHLGLADIPTLPMAFDSLDIVVIDDVDTGTLQVEQRQALADWVARGGTLVATSRPGGADALGGLADIAPVTARGTRNLSSLTGLANLAAMPLTATGSLLVPDVALKTEQGVAPRVLAMQDGVPLLTARDLGRGRVFHLAVSPGVAPLKGWDGLVPLFKRMLAEHTVRLSSDSYGRTSSYYNPYYNKVFTTYGSMFDMPGLQLPDPLLIGCFLWLYIMVIGPVNFIVLRRMGRTELAWITIPACVALFSIAAYALAFQSKGGDLVAIRANIVATEEGLSRGTVSQYLGLFSPQRNTYNLEAAGSATINEISPYGYGGADSNTPFRVSHGGTTTTVGNIRINTWSLRALMAESMAEVQSPLEADIHLGDNMIEGTVRNRTNSELRDVALIRGDAAQYIGTMAPGQRAEVKLGLSGRPFIMGSPSVILPVPAGVNDPTSQNYSYGGFTYSSEQRAYNRKVEALNAALQPLATGSPPSKLEVFAVAWGPQVPSNLNLVGATAQNEELNLWTSRLPINSVGNSKPAIKAGSVPFSIYAPGNTIEWTNSPLSGFYIYTGRYADASYRLPPGTQPDRLSLHYSASSINGDVDVLAFDASSGAWHRIDTLAGSGTTSAASTINISNPRNYVGPGGDVLIRLLPQTGTLSLTLQSFDLALNEAP